MAQNSKKLRLGILGGGQLARMLLQESAGLELAIRVLTAAADDPASKLGGEIVLGALDDEATLRSFFSGCDVITFESEFHPANRLARAAEGLMLEFSPSLQALSAMQDKLQQKRLLSRVGVASAPYRMLGEGQDWRDWLERCFEALGAALVLKWSRLGYDGKGTLFIEQGKALEMVPAFLAAAQERQAEVYAEARIDFVRELALMAVHSPQGAFCCYPLVISEQEAGICKRVMGPATALGVADALQAQAEAYARRVAEALPLHGAFALELFEKANGELLVNEMAPRVHNSGHYTLDGAACSQFENHLRAVGGMALGSTATPKPFAMLNLLSHRAHPHPPTPVVKSPFVLHWYEKSEARPGRKMGHINVVADEADALYERLDELRAIDERWLDALASTAEEIS